MSILLVNLPDRLYACKSCGERFKLPYVGPNAKWTCNCGELNSFNDPLEYSNEQIS